VGRDVSVGRGVLGSGGKVQALSSQGHSDPVEEEPFLEVVDRTTAIVDAVGAPFLMIGEIGSAVWGRDRGTKDIDLFVRPEAAPKVLEALGRGGFDTEVRFEHWLYKARLDGIDVDVIFRASRDILLDDEMLSRASRMAFRGRELPIAPAEDLLVMKAIATGEDTARYWYDALAILSRADLDWDYLLKRARQHGATRILSLLLFARSVDLVVPDPPARALFDAVWGAP
jgi:predicted nucleotidyltransferase